MKYNELLASIEEIKTATKKNSNTAEKVGSAMEGIAKLSGGVQIATLDISRIFNRLVNEEIELGGMYPYTEEDFGMSASELINLFKSQTLFFVNADIESIRNKFIAPSMYQEQGFSQMLLDLTPISSYVAENSKLFIMFMGNEKEMNWMITNE